MGVYGGVWGCNKMKALDIEHVSHAGWRYPALLKFLTALFELSVSLCWLRLLSGQQLFSCHSFLVLRPHKSLKPSKHFRRTGHLSGRLRGPSAALCRRIWRYLCWSLGEPERALRLLTPDSAVRKIRQRWFCWAEKNSWRCSCFQQNGKKTTENKCHGEREEGRQKMNLFGSVWRSTSQDLQFQMQEELQCSGC